MNTRVAGLGVALKTFHWLAIVRCYEDLVTVWMLLMLCLSRYHRLILPGYTRKTEMQGLPQLQLQLLQRCLSGGFGAESRSFGV